MHRLLIILLLLGLATPSAAQPCGDTGVSLQVLGSGGPALVANHAGSGVLIWIDGQARALVDAGGGAALRFADSGARMADLDVLLLTRLHASHTADLPALVESARHEPRTRPLPIFGPPGNRYGAVPTDTWANSFRRSIKAAISSNRMMYASRRQSSARRVRRRPSSRTFFRMSACGFRPSTVHKAQCRRPPTALRLATKSW
jgi:ribonuclease BN (tRNA processing enzyme)